MIYLDNAATTLRKPDAVIEAVADAMRNMGNSGRGSGSTSLRASRVIYEARRTLTEFFGGTDPSRLVFTSNSTEGAEHGNSRNLCTGRPCDHYGTGT